MEASYEGRRRRRPSAQHGSNETCQDCSARMGGCAPSSAKTPPSVGILAFDPTSSNPHPIIAAPLPMTADVDMAGRGRDHHFFDNDRRHRAYGDLHVVTWLPPPITFSPCVVPGYPVIAGDRRRRPDLRYRGRHFAIDDPSGVGRLSNDRRASPCKQRTSHGDCQQRSAVT